MHLFLVDLNHARIGMQAIFPISINCPNIDPGFQIGECHLRLDRNGH